MRGRARVPWDALLAAGAALVAYVVLGFAVSNSAPNGFDRGGAALLGGAQPLAILLTNAGRFPIYATVCTATFAFALVRREWRRPVLTATLALIFAWVVSDRFKELFHRARPEHWLYVHEASFSYSSGHATLALVYYGTWIYFIAMSDAPLALRRILIGALVFWIVATGWSRLALGAHYPTDVIGGYLLGLAILIATLGITASLRAAARPKPNPAFEYSPEAIRREAARRRRER